MKKSILVGILILFPFVISAAEVSFFIKNLESNKGSVRVAVFKGAENFPKDGKTAATCSSQGRLENKQVRVRCEVNPGNYGAAIFHDENGNKKMDKNIFGMPKEGYGFSNNAKGSFGPPKYKDAAFEVGSDDLELEIQLKY